MTADGTNISPFQNPGKSHTAKLGAKAKSDARAARAKPAVFRDPYQARRSGNWSHFRGACGRPELRVSDPSRHREQGRP